MSSSLTRCTDALWSESLLLPSLSRQLTKTRSRTRELPGHIPFVVQEQYNKEIIAGWREPCKALLESVRAILRQQVQVLVNHHFADFGQGLLEQKVWYEVFCKALVSSNHSLRRLKDRHP
jgi:hypothetical protein